MKFGPTRGHVLSIFNNFIKDFGLAILAIAVSLFSNTFKLTDNLFLFVLVIFQPFAKLYSYLFTVYSIDDEKIMINKGFVSKKHIEIPIKMITTVDFSQNIIYQLFHVYSIKIDNSSQTSDTASKPEVVISLKEKDALFVKSLLSKDEIISESETTIERPSKTEYKSIQADPKDIFLMGLLQAKLIYVLSFVTIFSSGGAILVFQLLGLDQDKMTESFGHTMETFSNTLSQYVGIAFSVILIILMFAIPAYLISTVISIIRMFIKYYNFTITDQGDRLSITFGFFTKKNYTLMKKKVSGVAFNQPLLMKLFGYGTVDIYVIGYGDKSDEGSQELSMIYPLMKMNDFIPFMQTILPEFQINHDIHKAKKNTLRYYFYCPRMFLSALFLIVSFFLPLKILITFAILLLLLSILSVFQEFKHSGLGNTSNVIMVTTGCFAYNHHYIHMSKIESITESAFFLKRRKGITNIRLGFLAPTRVAKEKIKNMTCQDFETLQEKLDY